MRRRYFNTACILNTVGRFCASPKDNNLVDKIYFTKLAQAASKHFLPNNDLPMSNSTNDRWMP